jgi:tRNA A-37 threonylcarbamoyl transferase component Bud32
MNPGVLSDADLARLAAASRTTLKADAGTTVEVLGSGTASVVRKTYHNRGLRWLQSFGRRSRAQREFDNLQALAAAGVRCTEALAWRERRGLGCVAKSSIVTRLLPDCRSLKQVLAESPAPTRFPLRRHLIAAAARKVAKLHRRGFLWCTAMPRNMLVVGDPVAAQIAICDVPAAIDLGHPVHGTRLALFDVFDAAFSPSRRADFSAPERLRWLVAYCDGDRAAARRLWRRLARRSKLQHDIGCALTMFWHLYVALPLRRRVRPDPDPPR